MKYAKHHFLSIEDIFPTGEDYAWLKGQGNICKIYGARDKSVLARQILHAFMHEMIWDCIEGKKFVSPVHEGMAFFVQSKPNFVTEEKRKRGYYRIYDFEKTDNKAYQLLVSFKGAKKVRYYPIRLARKHYAAIAGKANSGHVYLKRLYG